MTKRPDREWATVVCVLCWLAAGFTWAAGGAPVAAIVLVVVGFLIGTLARTPVGR